MSAPGPPLAHELGGAGPPALLLNGGMMTFGSWEPIAVRLRPRFTVLGCDFRGQLLSPGTAPATLAGHAADVEALLDHVGWPATHVVATSFGAAVAIELAARSPARVRSLVLVTVMDRATPEFVRGTAEMRRTLAAVLAGGERRRFYDALVDGVYSPAHRRREAAALAARREQVDRLPLAWFAGVDALLAAIDGFDLSDRLGEVRCPALMVVAAGDEVVAPERSRALAAALGAEVAVHPSSGHALVTEDPQWLAGVCLDFLDRQESTT